MNEPLASPPPPPPGPPASRAASTQAIIALVLGILGVLCCAPVAPVAWYLGSKEAAIADPRWGSIFLGRGPGVAITGQILGIIGTFMLVLELLFGVIWTLFFGGMAVLQGISNR